MLAAKPHGIAAAQAGIEQYVEPYPQAATDRPTLLIGGNIILGPRLETFGLGAGRGINASRRVVLDVLRLVRPTE
jgi:hypothetical protein